jgi:ABC-type lipoprotein export system ATPase subunit
MSTVTLERVAANNDEGLPVLLGVSASFKPAEAVAIVGRNGSGKTMLLRVIAGMAEPRAGKIRRDGADIGSFGYHDRQRYRSSIGFVFELSGLVGTLSVRDNLLLPLVYHADRLPSPPSPERRVAGVAEELDFVHALDDPATRLNASVCKRALFARALLLEPWLLLVDQPLRGLSREEAQQVADAVESRRRQRQMTVILADHSEELEPFVVQRTLYLEKGQLSAAAPKSARGGAG